MQLDDSLTFKPSTASGKVAGAWFFSFREFFEPMTTVTQCIERTTDGLTKEGRCDDPLTNDENVVCLWWLRFCGGRTWWHAREGVVVEWVRDKEACFRSSSFQASDLTPIFGVCFQRQMIGGSRIDLDTFQT